MAAKVTSRSAGKIIQRKPSGSRSAATAKRSASRRIQAQPSALENFARENLRWLFLGVAAIVIGVLLYVGYQKIIAGEMFAVKRVDVAGAKHVDAAGVEKIVRAAAAQTGVWKADLTAMQNEIENSAWVKTAVVSRVLPDGLRVRVTEREPKAVVRLESGAKVWVDDEARVLGAAAANESFPFVVYGWNEAKDNSAIEKNRRRVELYQNLLDEWRKLEIANRVTAIDLADVQDVEATVMQNETAIPVQLGSKNHGAHLKSALDSIAAFAANGNSANIERVIAYDETPVVRTGTNSAAAIKTATPAKSGKLIR